jgi:hypothetical protein
MELKTEREINEIRGKMLVRHATEKEIQHFLFYVSKLEMLVDEASCEDFYGTEGWKRYIGLDEK